MKRIVLFLAIASLVSSCKDKEVFDEEEIVLVTEYLKANPDIWNLGLLLQFQTGMRIGEIAALKWEDVNEKERCIHVHRTEKKYNGFQWPVAFFEDISFQF